MLLAMMLLVCALSGCAGNDFYNAAYRGALVDVQSCLAKGAGVNAKMMDGEIALTAGSMAFENGRKEVADVLVREGAKME